MPARIILEVVEGTMKGQRFVFDQHDTFLFGRGADCHCRLDGDDSVSRHHFIIEANPPDARIHDLGSTNGTYVNEVKLGGKGEPKSKTVGFAADLKDRDLLRVGETRLKVCLQQPQECAQCGEAMSAESKPVSGSQGLLLCSKCRMNRVQKAGITDPITGMICQECGKDVMEEVGGARWGNYVCSQCREKEESDPVQMLKEVIQSDSTEEQIPDVAGYDIQGRLGKGGYGAVYLAKRRKDAASAAVKVMLSRVAVNEASRRRFLQEIGWMRKLNHPNVVRLLDHGAVGSLFYFIMEYCDGGNMLEFMDKTGGRLSLSQAAPLFLQCLDGLEYVHAKGLVHRDLKPSNFLLKKEAKHWQAKIADMGLAKNFEAVGLSGMTMTGSYGGTPYFMPREQITDFKGIKPSSDVWSMAASMYHLLTGEFPRDFGKGKDPFAVVLAGEIVPIRKRNREIPASVAAVIDKALSRDPYHRYKDGGDMRRALAKAL